MNKVDKDVLYDLYVIRGKPMHQIAKELDIAIGSVYNYLCKFDIPRRSQKETFTMQGRKLSKEQCERISKLHKGKKLSQETKSKLSESLKRGGIGHKKTRSDGYVAIYFPDHPKCNKDGYVMEHDLIMECIIGRHLLEDEVVHHKNHIRNDNRKENLELMKFKEHAALHMRERHEIKKGGMTY